MYWDLELERFLVSFLEMNARDSAPSMVKRGRDNFLWGILPDRPLPELGVSSVAAVNRTVLLDVHLWVD